MLPQVEGRVAPARASSCPSQRAVLPQPEGRLAPVRGPSCPSQGTVLPQPVGRLAPARGPSCPSQGAVLPQPEGRLAPARGPSCPSQRAVLPQPEGRLAPARGPSCPSQRTVLPQPEDRLAPARVPSCPRQRAVLAQGWGKMFFWFKMATPGHWEVVGKTAKKISSQQNSKIPKKTSTTSVPKIEHASPFTEDPTIYGAFLAKEKKDQQQQQSVETLGASTKSNSDTSSPKKPRVIKKSNLPEKKKENPQSLEEALSKIEIQELQKALATSQESFPESRSIWLKDLASVLNLRLEKVTMIDPVFEDEIPEYPACLLPRKMRSLLLGQLRECPQEMLELFLEHCVQSMITSINKGGSTFGYCIFIQLLFSLKAGLASDCLSKYLDMLRNNQKRPLPCLSIMWALGQAGTQNLTCGLKVWQQLMVPVLNIRALSAYGALYLDSLFRRHPNLDSAYGVFTFHDFFPMLDLIFSQKSNGLPSMQLNMLQSLYPKLKLICFGDDRQNTLHNFFPSFLNRCLPNCPSKLQAELLECLVTCLAEDKQSFSRWRQMYTNHMVQTSLLLGHIVRHWDAVGHRLNKQQLADLLQEFSNTNAELASGVGKDIDGYTHCVEVCKELETKLSIARFPWGLTTLMITCLFGSIIYFDIFTHGSFEQSKTHSVLSDTGALALLRQTWRKILVYLEFTVMWLIKYVPIYYEKASVFAAPYLELLWQKLVHLGVLATQLTESTRTWLYEKVPELLHWLEINVPIMLNICGYYLNILWELLVYLAQQAMIGINVTIAWLEENVFVGSMSLENIQKFVVSVLMSLRVYVIQFFEWCKHAASSKS
ncbi:transmembrane protein 214 [Lamellibrachia satsuma]|nr:transmembrane protein 214 [Lamellibrachia satsuma]